MQTSDVALVAFADAPGHKLPHKNLYQSELEHPEWDRVSSLTVIHKKLYVLYDLLLCHMHGGFEPTTHIINELQENGTWYLLHNQLLYMLQLLHRIVCLHCQLFHDHRFNDMVLLPDV